MSTNEDREPLLGAGTAESPQSAQSTPADGAPRLPVRASIYIDVDGTVHFGALFEGLVPVADALGARRRANEGDESEVEHAQPERAATPEPVHQDSAATPEAVSQDSAAKSGRSA